MVDGQVELGASSDFLYVEVSAPLPCPSVVACFAERCDTGLTPSMGSTGNESLSFQIICPFSTSMRQMRNWGPMLEGPRYPGIAPVDPA